jgi:hypothetical protein
VSLHLVWSNVGDVAQDLAIGLDLLFKDFWEILDRGIGSIAKGRERFNAISQVLREFKTYLAPKPKATYGGTSSINDYRNNTFF